MFPVFVPEHMVNFGLGVVRGAGRNRIFDTADQARDAARRGRQPAVAYFVGAGGAVVAPTTMCPATAPRLVATMLEARRELGKVVADELTAVAISLVGGMVIRAVVLADCRRQAWWQGAARNPKGRQDTRQE